MGDLYHGCEVDHVVAIKHGGRTEAGNLAFACFHCNRHKGTDLGALSFKTGALVRFYNPRADRWFEHFAVWEGTIEPLTETADVTARTLEFNHPERVAFRRSLTAIGRYPTLEALARMRE